MDRTVYSNISRDLHITVQLSEMLLVLFSLYVVLGHLYFAT